MFTRIAIVGAGLMGTGIARHLASNGHAVSAYDADTRRLQQAREGNPLAAIRYVSALADIADADLVIEAVYEDLTVKQTVIRELESIVSKDCVLATNTSSLLVRDIAAVLDTPSRFLGIHYNNPADMNPIVEIIATAETSKLLASAVTAWMSSTGKHAIACADTTGFILNRQSLPYINEAARCVALATPLQVDRLAVSRLGVGLGPFAVMNLVGLDVMAAASRNLASLGYGYQPAARLQSQAAAGAWQIDADDARTPDLPADMADEIEARLLGSMMFPGRDILGQQLCSRDDLHLICREALGYARSSPELLEGMDASQADRSIEAYLRHQSG